MTKVVTFTTAVLLKEKGWKEPTLSFYFEDGESKENCLTLITGMDYGSEFDVDFSEMVENWNDKWLTRKDGSRCFGCAKTKGYLETFSAPIIAEVIRWLYEEHSFIILTIPTVTGHFAYKIIDVQLDPNNPIERPPYEGVSAEDYNNPWECYEAGIEYILKTII